MSIEHPISSGIFADAKSVEVQGGVFLSPRRIGLQNAGARILCQKHNSTLSNLDSEIVRVANALTSFMDSPRDDSIDVDGSLIERWILKLIIGVVSAGWVQGMKASPAASTVHQLFGLERLAPRFCLYGVKNVEVPREWNRFSWHRFYLNNFTREIDLGIVVVCGLPLMAYVGDGDPQEALRAPELVGDIDVRLAQAVRRPATMAVSSEGYELTLRFAYS